MIIETTSFSYPSTFFKSSQDVFTLMNSEFIRAGDLTEEHIWILCFNSNLRLIGYFDVSHGVESAAFYSLPSFYKRILLSGARSFIIVHNHPSGEDATPSDYDFEATKKVRESAELLELKLSDHIIISGDIYYSFADERTLNCRSMDAQMIAE